jgi:hypothetical protein
MAGAIDAAQRLTGQADAAAAIAAAVITASSHRRG